MATHTRRSVLSSIGITIPFGLSGPGGGGVAAPSVEGLALRFRSFEDALREAFADRVQPRSPMPIGQNLEPACRRIEVGHSDVVRAGVQGCHNDRPFAGFPAGRLRIVRMGFEPGPARKGVRLYVATVDVVLTDARDAVPSRSLDFASLPPAALYS